MKNFRKVWTKEMHDFLLENKNENRHTVYQKFLEKFQISDVTFTAFCNERSRIGAVNYHNIHGSTLAKPLFTESTKKGYIRVKVAQPNVWLFKSVYVWNQTHPDDIVKKYKEIVIFLNGDNRDFRPENLYKIPRTIVSIFNHLGGTVKGNPEMTLIRVKQAFMKHELFNRGRQLGLVNNGRFKDDIKEYNIKRNALMSPEEKEAQRQETNRKLKENREKLKLENPEAYQEMLKKKREQRKKFELEHPEIYQERLRRARENRRKHLNDTRKN